MHFIFIHKFLNLLKLSNFPIFNLKKYINIYRFIHDINRISKHNVKHYWNRTRHQRDINIFYLVTKQLLARSKIPYVFTRKLSMTSLHGGITAINSSITRPQRRRNPAELFLKNTWIKILCRDTKVNKFLHIYPSIPQNGDITNWRSGWYLCATRYLFPETRRMLISILKKILVRKSVFSFLTSSSATINFLIIFY